MKSLKLNLVFLILSSCGILLWGLAYLCFGTLLISGWNSTVFGEGLDIIGKTFGILINFGGVLILSVGIAIIVLAAMARKKFGMTQKQITTYRVLTCVADCLLVFMTAFNPFFWVSVVMLFFIPSMAYLAFVLFTVVYTMVTAFSNNIGNDTMGPY